MSDPTAEDVTAAERIVRYEKGTLDYGVTFSEPERRTSPYEAVTRSAALPGRTEWRLRCQKLHPIPARHVDATLRSPSAE